MRKQIIKIIALFLILNTSVYANSEGNKTKAKAMYDRIYTNISIKYQNNNEAKINYFTNFWLKLTSIKTKTDNKEILDLVDYLGLLNSKSLAILKSQVKIVEENSVIKTNISSGNIINSNTGIVLNTPSTSDSVEKTSSINSLVYPDFVKYYVDKWYKFYELDDNYEFKNDWITYRFSDFSYYVLNSSNYKIYEWKWYDTIVYFKNKYLVLTKYTKEQKLDYDLLASKYPMHFVWDDIYKEENWVLYSFNYKNYLHFSWKTEFYLSDLLENWLELNSTLLIKKDNEIIFVKDFTKQKLVTSSILEWITNKKNFINALIQDNNKIYLDNDAVLLDMKTTTESLISWLKTNDEKIAVIYSWVKQNIKYYNSYWDWTKYIYSWIWTFFNKIWVCDWYSKLFLYMLSFAWIDDVEQETWYVFDHSDFPNYWHAWNRIWNYYYDTTFDSSYKNTTNRYFKLTKELMYYNKIPLSQLDSLKNVPKSDRELLSSKNLYNLYSKYPNEPLMSSIWNFIKLWFTYNSEINISNLINNIWVYDVVDWVISTFWKKITWKLNYYKVDDSNLKATIFYWNINFDTIMFLKWYNNDWTFEYRLAYDVTY